MQSYVVRRVAAAIPLLFGLTLLAFLYVRMIPGDPVVAMLGVNSDPELVAKLRAELGLEGPLLEQYGAWLTALLQGDLGNAFRSGHPISSILIDRIPASVGLALGGFIVSMVVSIPLGVAAGVKRGSRLDTWITGSTLVGLAVPAFWLGAVLVMVVSVWLGWLPSGGYVPFSVNPARNLQLLILPSVTLGLAISPYLIRLTRGIVSEIRQETFVGFARSQGLARQTIAMRVVFRNAAPSLVVALGVVIGGLLAGSLFVEAVFNWPGMGRLMVAAVVERDYAMIQALLIVYGVLFITLNLLAEIAQGMLDPRIRL